MTDLKQVYAQVTVVEEQLANLKQKLAVPLFRLPPEIIVEVVAHI
jgi:hypothetical protein